jgi:uncharacterized sulfatase
MRFSFKINSFSIEDSNIIKGIGILLIAFHNFFHWTLPNAKENEFDFSINGIHSLTNGIISQPGESINLLFSFWGHFGVQLFIFISGYGLMKAYQNKKVQWGSFISKRINKLWPTFFFALFLFYSLMRLYLGWSLFDIHLLQSYFLRISFLSNFFLGKQFILNGPWWFYSMIVQLYMVFPLLLWSQKKFGNISLVLISVLAYLISILFNPWFVHHDSSLYLFFWANIPVFSLGMILASKKEFTYNHLYSIGAIVLFSLGNYFLEFWYFSHLMFSIFALALIYFILLRNKKKSYFYKTILFYGELSMYFYAIHGFLRSPFIELTNRSNHALITLAWAFAFIAFSTLIALALKWVVNNYLRILHSISNKVNSLNSSIILSNLKAIKSLMQIGTIFILMLIMLRIYEYILLKAHHDLPIIDINIFTNAAFHDFLAGIAFLAIILIPYLILYRISKKAALIITNTFFGLIIISSIMLIQYYDFTLTLLDRVIYVYSFESIMEIVSSADINLVSTLAFIISLSIFVILIIYSPRIKYKRLFVAAFPLIAIGIACIPNVFIPKESSFESEIVYTYSNNKLLYFINDISESSTNVEYRLKDIAKANDSYHKLFPKRRYLNPNYPFLRKKDIGNPLGSFLNKTKSGNSPNIVFIFVESLCPAVSGPNSYNASFTPFLDSLTRRSLFWRNNLSTAERTFGILPSALASLPFGENGFLDLSKNMPQHQSIISILKQNKYSSRFFYGGWTRFNNMDIFMKMNNIDTIINQFDDKDSIPPNENGFSWGYSDGAIFRSTFNTIEDSNNQYISVYLTLSTHSPFKLRNHNYYNRRVIERLDDLEIPKEERSRYFKNKEKLATFVYLDDELRNFFKQYAKRKDFENTIFVITGDHRGIIFSRTSQIDVYHTPLIIYSPMLKAAHEFGGLTSHLDLTPTILNYLEDDYQIDIPKTVSWLGGLIDTSTNYHSQLRMAFMRNNRDIRDYLSNDYYLASENLYKVSDNFNLTKVNDDSIKKRLKNDLANFKIINSFTIEAVSSQAQFNHQTLISEIYNFDQDVSEYYQEDTSHIHSKSGDASMLLSPNQSYGSICPSQEIGKGISRIYIDIDFDVLVSNFGSKAPVLVIDLQKDGKHIEWFGLEFINTLNSENQWSKVRLHKTLFTDKKTSEGSVLKIYIWNKHGTELFYDNLGIDIEVKQQ